MKPGYAVFLLLTLFPAFFLSCSVSNKTALHNIEMYFNASTADDKSRYVADHYHSWFKEKKGEGEDKNAALKSFLQWDAPLHPQIAIKQYSVNKNVWTIQLNEENDFTKLIGFPGWKATEIIMLNHEGLIEEATYIPVEDQPDYKDWLKPAVAWLQENMPDSLHQVYQDGKLIETEATAKKWVDLLKLWKQNTAR